MISSIAESEDWLKVARGMRFIAELSPAYELARWNLAIAYVNHGVQQAKEGNFHESLGFFLRAFRIETPVHLEKLIRENLAAAQSALGIEAHKNGDLEHAVACMESALTCFSSTETRSNLGTAYSVLAENLLSRGAYEDAIVNYIAAEETGVFTTEGFNNRAVAHVHVMQGAEALESFQTALAIDSDNRVAQQNLNLLKQNLPHLKDAILERFRTEKGTLHFNALPPPRSLAMNSVVTA
jgi:tetratricopeptide (TPR) repeat protein